jgi:hypothetical protein
MVFLLVALTVFLTIPAFAREQASLAVDTAYDQARQDAMGICPPIFLRDENGAIINPVAGINAGAPYSPKQTCGKCHDYDKITRGFHFQQGKGEKMTPEYAATYPWCTSPGQYGGRW